MKIFYVDPGLTKIAQVMSDQHEFSAWGGGDVLHEQSSTKEFYKRVIKKILYDMIKNRE